MGIDSTYHHPNIWASAFVWISKNIFYLGSFQGRYRNLAKHFGMIITDKASTQMLLSQETYIVKEFYTCMHLGHCTYTS